MKHHAVFISYRSVNETFASDIKREIERHFSGLSVFLSSHHEDGTTLGKEFQQEIDEKIAACAFVVLVLTNDWAQSLKCREEYERARSMGKIIFALFLEPEDTYAPELKAIERELGSETFAKVYPPSIEVAAKRVIGGLKKYIEKSEAYERAFFAFEGDNPYPGLGVYDIDEAAVYFGREGETHELLKHFFKRPEEKKRFLLVHGASGSGKSSFMRAGILARIALFYNDWHLLGGNAFRPGEDPLRSLCNVFAKASGEGFADVKKRVENKEDFTDLLWALKGERRYLLLAVDQLEELYQNREAHEAFFEALRLYLQTDGCYLIATVRTEYLQDIQSEVLDKERNMAQIMEVYNLPPISIGAIDDIITGPFEAKIAKGKIERGFVDSLKHDLAGKTKALPLLSLYLETHYERYGGHFLAKDYVSGKLFSTIDEKASEALEGIDEDDKEKLKEAFIRHLVFFDKTYDKALRKRASYEELFEVHKWIDRLIDARLLVKEIKGDDATVEVVHEAVFEHWKLLNGWIEEEKDFFIVFNKVSPHYEDWNNIKGAKQKEALLNGLLLEVSYRYKELFPLKMKEYIEESYQYKESEHLYKKKLQEEKEKSDIKRRQILKLALGTFTVGFAGTSYEWYEAYQAKKNILKELKNTEHKTGLMFYQKAFEYLKDFYLLKAHLFAYKALLKLDYQREESKELIQRLAGLLVCYPFSKLLYKDQLHTSGVWQVDISPDGRYYVSAGDDGRLIFRDVRTLRKSIKFYDKGQVIYDFVWLSNSELLLVERIGKLIVYDYKKNMKQILLDIPNTRFKSIYYDKETQIVYIGTKNGKLLFFDMKMQKILNEITLEHATTSIMSICCYENILYLSVSRNGVYCIDLTKNKKVRKLDILNKKQQHRVGYLSLNGNKLSIAMKDTPQELIIYNIRSKDIQKILLNKDKTGVYFTQYNKQQMYITTYNGLKILNLDKGHLVEIIDIFKQQPRPFKIINNQVIIGDWSGGFFIFQSHQTPHVLPGHSSKIYSIDIQSKLMVTGSNFQEGELRIWNLLEEKVKKIILGYKNASIQTIKFLTSSVFIWVDGLGNLGLYDIVSETKKLRKIHFQDINDIAVTKDKQYFFTASTDRTIKQWYFDKSSLEITHIQTFENLFEDTVYTVDLSPCERYLAAGSFDLSVKIIDLQTNHVITQYFHHIGHVYKVKFSLDGNYLYSAGRDHDIFKFHIKTKAVTYLKGHTDRIYHLDLTSDGKYLISSSKDNTLRIWNNTGKCLAVLVGHIARIYQFSLFDNDNKIASVSWDKTIRIWDISLAFNVSNTEIPFKLKSESTIKEFPQCDIIKQNNFEFIRLADGTILDKKKIQQSIDKLTKY